MSHEVKVHDAQVSILRELLFCPQAGFAEMQKPTGLPSDNFNFHIQRLIDIGYVEKLERGQYRLTPKGKEYANRLDTDNNTVERQPKVSVVLLVRNKNNPEKFLVQQRLKNPFYGFWGRLGGKVRFGETFEEAASREFEEETGLTGEFKFRLICRKIDHDKETDEVLEDKVFVIMECLDYSGQLMEKFEGGLNTWMTQDELLSQEKRFVTAHEFAELLATNETYITRHYSYEKSEY